MELMGWVEGFEQSATIAALQVADSTLPARPTMPRMPGMLGRYCPMPSCRPCNIATEVGVGEEFRSRAVPRNGNKGYLKAGAASVLHGRDTIGVVGDEGNKLNGSV